jgi:hypothetical protein
MFEVKNKCCNECLFSKEKIVDNKRRKEILASCAKKDVHFICHKATIEGKDICCRGFYNSQTSNLMRISQRMGWVEFVE